MREAAQELGLAGWVRNDPDGSVVVAIAGEADLEQEFVVAVRRGPPGARVDAVEDLPVERLDPPITTPFRIVR